MSHWQYDYVGRFGSEREAENWAKGNGIALTDIRTSADGDGVRLETRRSQARRDDGHNDYLNGRKTGYFR
ncbi:MAG: hypothetical protein ACSHW2_01195 [Parasphingopyxis sp.]